MTVHKLKLSFDYYADSEKGIKTFEIRRNDRDYKVGDVLELREWLWSEVQHKGAYTGSVHWKIITYVFDAPEYLQDGYVCLGVAPIAEPEDEEAGDKEAERMALNDDASRAIPH